MTGSDEQLAGHRQRIDGLDQQILKLLNGRARIAQEVAEVKRRSGGEIACYRPDREAQVLRLVQAENAGPLPDEAVGRLFREIMSACLALEQPLHVAYLGPEGTYCQAASLKHFGQSIQAVPCANIDLIFQQVEAKGCDYGVVPVENSIEGVIHHTLDLFVTSPLKVCGEVDLPIHHHLLSHAANLKAILRIYAHPQALAQCRRWLDLELPCAEQVPISSNAEGARRAAQDEEAAAIASAAAGERYGLPSLASDIADDPRNTTRFLVIGRQDTPPSGHDKTSLLFATRNEPGALHRALAAFAEYGVSMTRIESRPSRQAAWEYVFFVDVEGHAADPQLFAALAALRERVSTLKVLGAYPQAVL